MKRLILIFSLIFLTVSSFASEKEWVRISGFFSPKGIEANSPEGLCASTAFLEWYVYENEAKFSGPASYSCYLYNTSTKQYFWTNAPISCNKGGTFSLERPDGCYEFKEPEEPKQCPAAGTYLLGAGQAFHFASASTICYGGCVVKGDSSKCVDDPESETGRSCTINDPFYTGKSCTGEDGTPQEGEEKPTDPEDPNTGGGTGGETDPENPNTGGGTGGETGGTEGGTGTGGNNSGVGTGGSGTGNNSNGEGEKGEDDKGESTWGGSCSQGFQGEGDALAVAIAKAEWERNCTFIHNPKDTEEYQTYNTNKTENQGEGGALEGIPTETIDLNQHLKSTNLLGAGSCLPDYEVPVLGRSITIPISEYCDVFRIFGIVLQALAMIWGARIALGGL